MSGNLSSYHFLLPGRRGKGPGRQPPGKITGVRSALLPPDPCQYHRWPREGQRGRGGNTRPSSANYNPSLRGLSFRVCSAISGKEKKKKKSDTVQVAIGAASARIVSLFRCRKLPNVLESRGLAASWSPEIAEQAPTAILSASASSGNCRRESSELPSPFRLFPAAVETDKLDDDGSFGSFRRQPLLAELMSFYYVIKTRRGVTQNCCPSGDI